MEALDHVVINTLSEMEGAVATFERLGFRLTPRGHHSLGSINHLMVAATTYLELVGLPATGKQREEIRTNPLGLNGLVLKTDDAVATRERLTELGLNPAPISSFSRPVEIDGETREARFRTVKLPADLLSAGRVYCCEHLTPELVWRPEWQQHPNGFAGFDHLVVESPDPARDAEPYAALAGQPAVARPDGIEVTFDGITVKVVAGPVARFARLGLAFETLERLEAAARTAPGVTWQPGGPGRARLGLADLDLTLDCRSAA